MIINSFYDGVVVTVCINMIAVLGMSVLTGFTRLFSFGNAGFMSIGAYTAAICSVQFHLPFPIALLCGAVMAGIVAFLVLRMKKGKAQPREIPAKEQPRNDSEPKA